MFVICFFFYQAEDGIRDLYVTGVQTCALPISGPSSAAWPWRPWPSAAGGSGLERLQHQRELFPARALREVVVRAAQQGAAHLMSRRGGEEDDLRMDLGQLLHQLLTAHL